MTNLLNWPDWTILAVEETDREYYITARPTNPPDACPHCGTMGEFVGFGKKDHVYLDLPIHAKRTGITVPRRRYRCKACGRTFFEPLPEMDENRQMTKRLVEYIQKESLGHTFVWVADTVGVTEGTVRHIFNQYIDILEQAFTFAVPRVLGIDELHLLGEMRCILTDIEKHQALELLAKRDKKTVQKYLSDIKGKDAITIVVMDMWHPYRQAVEAVLPKAKIIVDKFHVVRMATDAMDTIRKELRSTLTDPQRRTLKRDRFVLLRRRHDLKEKDLLLLDIWTANFPLLGEAYRLKESFFDIYEAKSRKEAEDAYTEWRKSVPSELEVAFKDLITATKNWHGPIFNYFDTALPLTNAYTEAKNGAIKSVNGLGRGYSFNSIRAKLLFHERHRHYISWRKRMLEREREREVEHIRPKGSISSIDSRINIDPTLLPEGVTVIEGTNLIAMSFHAHELLKEFLKNKDQH